jgi:hypothetical protein
MRALCCPSSSEAVLTGEIAEFLDGGLSELDAHASMVTENSSELERAGVVIICRGFFLLLFSPCRCRSVETISPVWHFCSQLTGLGRLPHCPALSYAVGSTPDDGPILVQPDIV